MANCHLDIYFLYNGFSTEIKNHMQTMAVAWNGTTLNDKVKLLSVTEVGYSHSNAKIEGNRYFIYTPHIKSVPYWLRTYDAGGTDYVWYISDAGQVGTRYIASNYSLVPCIRLGISLL